MNSSYKIYFRPIETSDRNVVRALHEEWFPIRYHDFFYDNITQNKMYDGSPLYTCVACAVRSDIESPSCLGIDAIRIKDAWTESWKVLKVDGLYDEPIIFKNVVKYSESNKNDEPSTSDENESNERIVACLIGRFIDNPSEENKILLISDPTRHTTLFYVMTLGVIDNFRKCGLATVLVERAIRLAQQVTTCSAIYLHVITYNTPAIQFYEKLGFRRITELKDYYNIDGTFYNCYLYAFFIDERISPRGKSRIWLFCKGCYTFILRLGRSLNTLSIFQNVFYGKSKSQCQ